MEKATDEAQSLIESLDLIGIDGIYTTNLPEELIEETGKTVIFIQNVNINLDDEGNNVFHTLKRQVEVQIFYKIDLDVEPSDIQLALLNAFVKANWLVPQPITESMDPDTKQLTQTFYFTQNKKYKEEVNKHGYCWFKNGYSWSCRYQDTTINYGCF